MELTLVLLAAALVLFASVICNRLSARVGMPVLLAFIFLGMIFGVDGPVGIAFDNYAVTEQVATVALLFIMFYGGFGTNWRAARPVAAPSILLSTAGVAATALLTGVFCRFALGMRMTEGLLVGAVLGSTDAASVFSILRARRLALKENTASMLEIESGSNDPCAYMMTALVLSAMQGGFSVGGALFLLLRQVGLGLALGAGIGLAAIRLLRRLGTDSGGFDMVFVVATAVLAYALPAALGGNGYLSVYLAGILLGNSDIRNKKQLVPFFDGVTSLCQLVLFFLLGLLCTPHRLPAIAGQALAISLFLLLAARPAAVFLLLAPFKASTGQKLLVSWSGLRGAASIVFAVMCGAGGDGPGPVPHHLLCGVGVHQFAGHAAAMGGEKAGYDRHRCGCGRLAGVHRLYRERAGAVYPVHHDAGASLERPGAAGGSSAAGNHSGEPAPRGAYPCAGRQHGTAPGR